MKPLQDGSDNPPPAPSVGVMRRARMGEVKEGGEGTVGRAHACSGLIAPSRGIRGDGDKVTIEDVSLKIFLRDC